MAKAKKTNQEQEPIEKQLWKTKDYCPISRHGEREHSSDFRDYAEGCLEGTSSFRLA
jgi:hypothetical protein